LSAVQALALDEISFPYLFAYSEEIEERIIKHFNQPLSEGNQSYQPDKEDWTRIREDYWLPAQADC